MNPLDKLKRIGLPLLLALFVGTGCATGGAGGNVDIHAGAYYYDDWWYGGGYYGDIDVGPLPPHPAHPIALPPGGGAHPANPIANPPKAEVTPSAKARTASAPRAAPTMRGGGGRGGGRR
jgi:hypothetical protein